MASQKQQYTVLYGRLSQEDERVGESNSILHQRDLLESYAQAKGKMIDDRRHRVLRAPHPSPLSAHRGFLGCGHFSAANDYLRRTGRPPIDWSLPPRAQMPAVD